jgi:hypothetical protein
MADRRQLEPWGGDVHLLPGWLRLRRRKPEPEDTPEKQEESHKGKVGPEEKRTVLKQADQIMWGGFRDLPK